MSDNQHLVQRYIAVWNETDPAARRLLVDEVLAADARYTDPLADVTGLAAFDAVVAAVQEQFPGFVLTLGAVDTHHHLARFTWELGPAGGESAVIGFDVVEIGDDGLVHSVQGFLDKVPAGA
ncbi:nuclear transport factor 2 family protein [Actinacidiphila alni]|uniref:nuclear transport factor 2 family protein n=1 Tax=Actinacidiphila alni TaxID=380248 RepID=UPI0033D4D8C9